MNELARIAVRAVYVALCATAFLFAGAQLFAGAEVRAEGALINVIGTCPPFDDQSCNQECINREFHGGDCDVKGDCICMK